MFSPGFRGILRLSELVECASENARDLRGRFRAHQLVVRRVDLVLLDASVQVGAPVAVRGVRFVDTAATCRDDGVSCARWYGGTGCNFSYRSISALPCSWLGSASASASR